MTKKILFAVFLFALIIGGFGSAEAQTATFPSGCASALGYSATTGQPCSGTSTAIPRYMPGCTSALGYSATNGAPCSGGSVALTWLAGCTSILGFSSISGEPCNGTLGATIIVPPAFPPITPGLPTTGAGGNAMLNIMLLILSGGVAVLGARYLIRERHIA